MGLLSPLMAIGQTRQKLQVNNKTLIERNIAKMLLRDFGRFPRENGTGLDSGTPAIPVKLIACLARHYIQKREIMQ